MTLMVVGNLTFEEELIRLIQNSATNSIEITATPSSSGYVATVTLYKDKKLYGGFGTTPKAAVTDLHFAIVKMHPDMLSKLKGEPYGPR